MTDIQKILETLQLQVPVYNWKTLPDGRVKLFLGNGHKPIVVGVEGAGNSGLESLPSSIVAILQSNGFDTTAKIRSAADADLLALSGIGQVTLGRIRDAIR